MKYVYLVLTLFFLFFGSVGFSQNTTRVTDETNLNLPPGSRLHPKAKIYDLSFKLNKSAENVSYLQSDLKFLKELSNEELENQKNENPEYYTYYMTGKSFINALSSKVKGIYTETELWYIYAYDQKLKNMLTAIK
ncbi:MAG TPA: hypothetical protein VLB74_07015 [Flavobacterium sp.]|uniref:hypothetical protein n=1 Tax=Flavobacterium sp. TaxID=239 RepID=UPI002CF30DC0|nr:hypothetical protein [Flavobacterium sp.]HSD14382.1 hypothetical protein [Flavobacterium sp.]